MFSSHLFFKKIKIGQVQALRQTARNLSPNLHGFTFRSLKLSIFSQLFKISPTDIIIWSAFPSQQYQGYNNRHITGIKTDA